MENERFRYENGQIPSFKPREEDQIVITGMAAKLPDSYDIYHFRENLYNKVDMVSGDYRRWKPMNPEVPQRTGKLYDIDKFDGGFFDITSSQGDNMDPMIRLVLERVYEAIIDSGHHPSDFENTKTGVFVGISSSETEEFVFYKVLKSSADPMTCNHKSMIAKRISYYLKLKGSAFALDMACSTSLSAVEQAYSAFRDGLCDKAIVCGTQLCIQPKVSLQFARLGVLSRDGSCKSFDAKGNGYARSEAIVAIILEKTKDANRIYGEIIHAKTNCDGYKKDGITFPSSDAQKTLLKDFYEQCKIDPKTLTFVEGHGTGTKAGDPEELSTIDEVFCKGRNTPLYIGAVKSNIGHSEPVSGLCGIVKTVIAMETGYIPPNINFEKPREGVEGLAKGRMIVVTDKMSLPDQRGLFGINSFGFGGGNSHILLHWNPKAKVNDGQPNDDLPRLICISSRVEDGINTILNDFCSRKCDAEYAYLIQHAFRKSIENHRYRGYGIYDKHDEINRSLSQSQVEGRELYFVFSNFDKDWLKLGPPLMTIPFFGNSIKSIQNILLEAEDIDVLDIVSNSIEGNLINQVIGSVAIQISLANLLKEMKLSPDRIIGIGSGAFVAAHLDNYLTLKQTILGVFYVASNLSKDNAKDWSDLEKILSVNGNSYEKWIPIHEEKFHQNCATYFANNVFSISGKDVSKLIPKAALSVIIGSNINDVSCNVIRLIDHSSRDYIINLLTNFGRLYECGFDMELERLYPTIKLPVSRGTPMLSPLIKWNHKRSWHVFFYQNEDNIISGQRTMYVVPKAEEWAFVVGHVIDGRNLFPATGYLVLVWESLSIITGKLLSDMKIVFEDVKYIRAVNIPKQGSLELMVTIYTGIQTFEISEGGVVIVRGKVYEQTDEQVFSELSTSTYHKRELSLDEKDIYKELKLRGYHYSGVFRSIRNCSEDGSYGIIEWANNWIAFMDCLLQMLLLRVDSRSLFVPTSISQLIIDAPMHLSIVKDLDKMIPVYLDKHQNVLKGGGVEIKGLGYSAIPKRKGGVPVLEISKFIPNHTRLNVQDSLRSLVQLVLENSNTVKVKVVELLAEDLDENDLLYPVIQKSLDDLPLMQQDIIILTKKLLELPRVTVENKPLNTETHCSILIVSNLLETVEISVVMNVIKDANGFVITRESLGVDLDNFSDTPFKILASHTTENEMLVFLSLKQNRMEDYHCFNLTNALDNLEIWIPELQELLKQNKRIILYAQNEELSGILGFVMCLKRESYADKISCFMIMDDAPKFDPELDFYKQQLDKDMVINIWKEGSWGTYRHLLLPSTQLVEKEHCYVNVTTRGDLSTLTWLEGNCTLHVTSPPQDDIVHIYYSALNFRDLMTASGKVAPEVTIEDRIEQDCVQGFEFSGRNSNGERVMGIGLNRALGTLLTQPMLLLPIPDGWTMEDGATVIAVYGTVVEMLLKNFRPKPGQSILIHSGTGGVGQAAINLCIYFRLNIFVTVGTEAKRNFIKMHYPQVKEEHILNSRDTSFENMIHQHTNGRGVDFVLNSLAEEKLIASIRCLATGGKFLEIGKFDLASNNALALQLLEKEAEFISMSVDKHLSYGNLILQSCKEELKQLIACGAIKPLPRTVFKCDEVEKAFRYMGAGKHIGKVLIKIRDEENQNVCPVPKTLFKAVPRFYCKADCSYLVCGGLGGFGLELADFLVLRGAKKLVLTSKSGVCNGYQRYRMRIWKYYGVTVTTSTQDASTVDGCTQLLNIANELGPVDGIFNLAVVLKDALFENQSADGFRISLIPKAYCTRNLDSVSRELCPNLRYFVIFSSVSCGRGNIGQTNYGMANSFMERICEKRKRDGYPALAIQWGAIGEVGLVAKMQEDNRELVIGGTLQQKVSNCLEVMDRFLMQGEPVVASMLIAEKKYGGRANNLFDAVLNIMGITNLKFVSVHSFFPEMGMDSMMAVEIKQTLEREYEVFLTAQDIKELTLSKLQALAKSQELPVDVVAPAAKTDLPIDMKLLLSYIGSEEQSTVPLLKLKTLVDDDEVAPHIFALPGIEGVAAILESLCGKLRAHVSCLQYSLDNKRETITQLAESVLPYIESTSRDLIILAYSFGCVVAMELLYILEAKGRTVKVFFIDGSPQLVYSMVKTYFPTDNEGDYQISMLSILMMRYMSYEETLKHQEPLMRLSTFAERIEYLISVSPKVDTSAKYIKEMCISCYDKLRAVLKYKIRTEKVKSQLTLLKAKTAPVLKAPADYGLSNMCENKVEIITVEGDHVTVLKNDDLAREINRISWGEFK